MSEIDPISDGYIDSIIKSNTTGTADPSKTNGSGLRVLTKLMRDRLEQEAAGPGFWYGGGGAAYSTLSDAYAAIPAAKREGLTIGVMVSGKIVEYWWPTSAVADGDLVTKSNYLPSTGGTVTGNVTINGDLDTNGHSISGKTEDLEDNSNKMATTAFVHTVAGTGGTGGLSGGWAQVFTIDEVVTNANLFISSYQTDMGQASCYVLTGIINVISIVNCTVGFVLTFNGLDNLDHQIPVYFCQETLPPTSVTSELSSMMVLMGNYAVSPFYFIAGADTSVSITNSITNPPGGGLFGADMTLDIHLTLTKVRDIIVT